jgi:uncharacterized membrane protein (DUF4010 family)
MKLRKKFLLELRALLIFLAGAWVVVPMMYMAYRTGHFHTAPAWFVVCFGVLITFLGYLWWRQGLSADKTKFKSPPIW